MNYFPSVFCFSFPGVLLLHLTTYTTFFTAKKWCPPLAEPLNCEMDGYCNYAGRGQQCRFTCNEGYVMIGNATLTCSKTLFWNSREPTCIWDERCRTPKKPENGDVICQNENENCKFSCKSGYTMYGKPVIVCQDGKWSDLAPTCKKTCKDPIKPKHGDVKCNGGNKDCEFSCQSDYKINGTTKIVCLDGKWSDKEPTCTKKCKTPDKPQNGDVTCRDENESCEFSCKSNYTLDGKPVIVCQEGNWSDKAPTCKKQCKTPAIPDHGHMNCDEEKTKCEFSCDRKYRLDGNPIITCFEEKWSGTVPTCVKKCQTPDIPDHGSVKCSNETIYCEFSCDRGYKIDGNTKITCHNGEWLEEEPTCIKKCPTPEKPKNGDVICRNQNENCEFTCKSNYTLYGKPMIVCRYGEWIDEMPTCKKTCKTPEKPNNGAVKCNDGNKDCEFSCDTDYKLVGKPKIVCLDGKWSDKEPTCTKKCKTPYKPQNGDVICRDENERCEFSCKSGYTIYGKPNIVCQEGTWSDKAPTCKKQCKTPAIPDHGHMKCDEEKTKCEFSCDRKYRLDGNPIITCYEEKWSSTVPTCIKKCQTPESPDHGSVQCSNETIYCEFSCDPGYKIDGKTKLICHDGKWLEEEPTCIKKCPTPEKPENGDVICRNLNENCEFSCNSNYTLYGKTMIVCRNGVWIDEIPTCKKTCKNPIKPEHGDVKCNDGNKDCEFSCQSDYKINGKPKIVCLDGKWSDKEPTCIKKCKTPDKPKNGDVVCRDENESCTFSCKSNYTIYGKPVIVCQDGKWSDQEPTCKKTCKTPDKPKNGDVKCNEGNKDCEFSCQSHYHLSGNTTTIACLDGKWSEEAPTCKRSYEDCASLKKSNNTFKSGVYEIYIDKLKTTIDVYCDMTTDGGGWTVFQKRTQNGGKTDFFRNWTDYKKGFANNMTDEFWLGNEYIHAITDSEPQMLQIDLEDYESKKVYARYCQFSVENETAGYRLHVQYYNGTAGDSFSFQSDCKFITEDSAAQKEENCAKMFKGAWWYNNITSCHKSNLNGLNLKGNHSTYADGIEWYTFHGYYYSLKKTEMKMRPCHCKWNQTAIAGMHMHLDC